MHSRREGEGGREVTLTCRRQQNALEAVEKLLYGINQILRSEDGRGEKAKKKKVSYHTYSSANRSGHVTAPVLLIGWNVNSCRHDTVVRQFLSPINARAPLECGAAGPAPGGLSHR